jgi:hypothetical protein
MLRVSEAIGRRCWLDSPRRWTVPDAGAGRGYTDPSVLGVADMRKGVDGVIVQAQTVMKKAVPG